MYHIHAVSKLALKNGHYRQAFDYFSKKIKDRHLFDKICGEAGITEEDLPGQYFNKLLRAANANGVRIK